MKAEGFGGGTSPLLIVGGGYHACEDDYIPTDSCGVTSPKGNRIYVLDANDGSLEKTFNTDRGVVSDVFVIVDKTTGLAKWAYAADTGGNIYRIGGGANSPFGTTAPGSWTITKIASLGCAGPACASGVQNRKFLMPLDVVEEPLTGAYVILAGSGDREKPLQGFGSAAGVDNYFFRFVDFPTDPNWLAGELPVASGGNGHCNTAIICFDSLLTILKNDNNPLTSETRRRLAWRRTQRAGSCS